jgi:hypothetical protein
MQYYYNNVPGIGKCRNNLIYTSLISDDKKTFCKWYYNDEIYHGGQNEVVDTELMEEKWNREVKYLTLMQKHFSQYIPEIKDIDYQNKKIYLSIDGDDFWEQSGCKLENYEKTLLDWKYQMLEIISAHHCLGLYKMSLHPSSYFIINGKLKSINYFFCYDDSDGKKTVHEHLSHISLNRRMQLFPIMKQMNMNLEEPLSLLQLQLLCFESFRNNYTNDFIEKCIKIYV